MWGDGARTDEVRAMVSPTRLLMNVARPRLAIVPRLPRMAGVVALMWVTPVLGQPRSAPLQGILTADISALPDAFSSQCGRRLSGMPGIGAMAAMRWSTPKRFVLQLDTRAALITMPGGCDADLPLFPLANGVTEGRPGVVFDHDTPTAPFVVSTMRVGVSQDLGSGRLTILGGGGLVWAKRPLPLGSVGLSGRVGGSRRALYWEIDRAQVWLRGTETRTQWLPGADGATLSWSRTVRRQLRPAWASVRLGMSMDWRAAR